MRRIRSDDKETARNAADMLRREGVVVLPTDTLYGMSAAISSYSGYQRILRSKGYGADRRFIHLAASVDMVEAYVSDWGCTSREKLDEIWPNTFSAILPAGDQCPTWIGNSIAVRVPDLPSILAIIDLLGEPIVSTSINRVGEPPLDDVDVIEQMFGTELDLLVVRETFPGHRPSTLVDFSGEVPVLLRWGAYAWAADGNPSK